MLFRKSVFTFESWKSPALDNPAIYLTAISSPGFLKRTETLDSAHSGNYQIKPFAGKPRSRFY